MITTQFKRRSSFDLLIRWQATADAARILHARCMDMHDRGLGAPAPLVARYNALAAEAERLRYKLERFNS